MGASAWRRERDGNFPVARGRGVADHSRDDMTFLTILGMMLLGDVLWGWLSFRALRRRGCPKLAAAAAGWAALQIGLLVFVFCAPRGGWATWPESLPRPLYATLYLWHLLVLPPWLIWSTGRG